MFGRKEGDIPEERKQALFLRVRTIIASQLKIGEEKIIPASKINEDLGADSLDALEIVMALEEEFNLEILDEDQEKIKTVEDVVVYLAQRGKI